MGLFASIHFSLGRNEGARSVKKKQAGNVYLSCVFYTAGAILELGSQVQIQIYLSVLL